jgi:antirestriction protein ArdC
MGYRAWQKHGRQVRKGERGLTILAPMTRKSTKDEIAAGAGPTAAVGGGERSVVGYRAATVFDYAQTDAAREGALTYVPPAPRLDTSDPDGLAQALASVAGAIGYAVHYDEAGYADGRCSFTRRQIHVNPALSPADQAAVLCHELAHALAHDPKDRAKGDPGITTEQREIQAEGAAFVALAALGLDTSRASLPYLKGWAGSDHEALRRELAAIDRIARDLLGRVEASASEPEKASAEA